MGAFLDNSSLNFRSPILRIKIGSESYSCAEQASTFTKDVLNKFENNWMKVLQIIAAIMVEDRTFAYLNGQPIGKGFEKFEPIGNWQELNAPPQEVQDFLDAQLFSIYRESIPLNTCWDDRLIELSKSEIHSLINRNTVRKAERQFRNLMTRLGKSNLPVVNSRSYLKKNFNL